MLNHHSLNLLAHLSVLAFRRGEYLVKSSRKASNTIYLAGKSASSRAMTTRAPANFSLACTVRTNSTNLAQQTVLPEEVEYQ